MTIMDSKLELYSCQFLVKNRNSNVTVPVLVQGDEHATQ